MPTVQNYGVFSILAIDLIAVADCAIVFLLIIATTFGLIFLDQCFDDLHGLHLNRLSQLFL